MGHQLDFLSAVRRMLRGTWQEGLSLREKKKLGSFAKAFGFEDVKRFVKHKFDVVIIGDPPRVSNHLGLLIKRRVASIWRRIIHCMQSAFGGRSRSH